MVVISNAHILYAQWGGKPSINEEMIEFNQDLKYDYNGQHQPAVYEAVYQAVYGSGFDIISFTIQYKRQVLDNEWLDTAVNAGVYDVKITKAEDENYDYFEKLYENVMTINKINCTIDDTKADLAGSSYKQICWQANCIRILIRRRNCDMRFLQVKLFQHPVGRIPVCL